jgi:nicotinic acid mononucleotide adenylyltransferase
MCELAVKAIDKPYFVMVDEWEAKQSEYQPTAKVIVISIQHGPVLNLTGTR